MPASRAFGSLARGQPNWFMKPGMTRSGARDLRRGPRVGRAGRGLEGADAGAELAMVHGWVQTAQLRAVANNAAERGWVGGSCRKAHESGPHCRTQSGRDR